MRAILAALLVLCTIETTAARGVGVSTDVRFFGNQRRSPGGRLFFNAGRRNSPQTFNNTTVCPPGHICSPGAYSVNSQGGIRGTVPASVPSAQIRTAPTAITAAPAQAAPVAPRIAPIEEAALSVEIAKASLAAAEERLRESQITQRDRDVLEVLAMRYRIAILEETDRQKLERLRRQLARMVPDPETPVEKEAQK